MTSYESYFKYLKSRSLAGLLYRRLYLYPILCRHLTGLVLDVGCGLGDMIAFRPNTIGVDINPKAVEWCKAKGLDVVLMQQNVLPFKTGIFSGTILDNVLEHLSTPGPLLSEIHRILKYNGLLIVGVPGLHGYDFDKDHKFFYDENTIVKTLSEYGFTAQKLFHSPMRSDWLNQHMPQYCIYGVFIRR